MNDRQIQNLASQYVGFDIASLLMPQGQVQQRQRRRQSWGFQNIGGFNYWVYG